MEGNNKPPHEVGPLAVSLSRLTLSDDTVHAGRRKRRSSGNATWDCYREFELLEKEVVRNVVRIYGRNDDYKNHKAQSFFLKVMDDACCFDGMGIRKRSVGAAMTTTS